MGRRADRPVIKAFNIYFKSLLGNGRPKGAPDRITLPVAGDPFDARATVLRLVDELGFDPIDAGGSKNRGASSRARGATPGTTMPRG